MVNAKNSDNSKSPQRPGRQEVLKRLKRSSPRKLRVSVAEVIGADRGARTKHLSTLR